MIMLTLFNLLASAAAPAPDCNATVQDDLRRTFLAVCRVESGGDPCAVNRRENAVGIAQIRPIVVADCNRIIGRNKWTLADRRDVAKSFDMFRLYVRYYQPRGGPEQWARTWNGGPHGSRKTSTLIYWQRVQAVLAAK